MTTDKQKKANQQNAQLSTGPKTTEGKLIVTSNPIKHGIFTTDLIISSAVGKENEEEYQEILNNLLACLSPEDQMQSLLVEKIAADFWRLRRVMRFEVGSIQKHIEELFKEFYSGICSGYRKTNSQINQEIQSIHESIEWTDAYIKCLKKKEATFDKPTWKGKDIESDILEDLYLIARSIDELTREEKDDLYEGHYDFEELKTLIAEHGYSSDKEISEKLITAYTDQKKNYIKDIEELEQEKLKNTKTDQLNTLLGTIPKEENTDKILKYDRSLQKSIFQNLIMLKKLQGTF